MAASITIQFHPDWPFAGGTVLEAIAATGRYRSQFETGISNGGLTAVPGGDRWHWESRLFRGRYDGAPPHERPIYGAWNRRDDPYGGAIRFGSAHLRLRPHVLERATFCFPDSVFEPDRVGGPEVLAELAGLADEAASNHAASDQLDDYVEAHVHGGLDITRDVEAIVIDPSHLSTAVETAAHQLGCAVETHPGFRTATPIDATYRGAQTAALAATLAEPHHGVLTPRIVGDAARSGAHDPQQIKRLWHCLARFGALTP